MCRNSLRAFYSTMALVNETFITECKLTFKNGNNLYELVDKIDNALWCQSMETSCRKALIQVVTFTLIYCLIYSILLI